jgi:uncharacterized protein YrzB (UPF0473 family)
LIFISAKRHVGDVDLVLTERDTDETDDTRDVLVLENKQCRIGTDFDAVPVDNDDAWDLVLANECAAYDARLATLAAYFDFD